MFRGFKGIISWLIAGTSVGPIVYGAEGSPVWSAAATTHLRGEFRSEFIYDDHGVAKHTGYKPTKSTTLGVTHVNLLLDGDLNADTEYAFRFNLWNPTSTPLDYGYGTHWFNKTLGFSIGKERIMQGGWDHQDQGYQTHVEGFYAQNLAMKDFDGVLALHLKAAGLLSLQVVNDVKADKTSSNPDVSGRWNKDTHPTIILGWLGEFGPIRPLLDVGSYDNNKSRWIDVGIKAQLNSLRVTLDYHNDSVAYRVPVAGAPDQNETNTKIAYTANASFEVPNLLTPWLYYSNYEQKQASDASIGLSGHKYNTATAVPITAAEGGYTYTWDNNGTTWGLGADFGFFGKNWNPFLAFVRQSGRFLKGTSAADTETRSENLVKLGILGRI